MFIELWMCRRLDDGERGEEILLTVRKLCGYRGWTVWWLITLPAHQPHLACVNVSSNAMNVIVLLSVPTCSRHRMASWLTGNIGYYAGGVMWGGVDAWGFFLWFQCRYSLTCEQVMFWTTGHKVKNMKWGGVYPLAGQGRFKWVVFLLQDNKNRVTFTKCRSVARIKL